MKPPTKKLEAYYDLIEPGANEAIKKELDKIGENTGNGVLEAEMRSINQEFEGIENNEKEKERKALKNFRENCKLEKELEEFLINFKLFINKTLVSEKTKLDILLQDLQNGNYDDDLFETHEKQIDDMPVVIPLFDVEKFLETVNLLKEKQILEGQMNLEENLGSLNKKLDEVKEKIEIAKNWHKAYQEGIQEQRKK